MWNHRALALRAMQAAVACALASVLAGCGGVGMQQDFPPAAAKSPAVGENWTYHVVNAYNGIELDRLRFEVTSASPQRFEVRITDQTRNATVSRAYDAGWNPYSGRMPIGLGMGGYWSGIYPGAAVTYAPALPLFRFPLGPGASWRDSATVTDPVSGKTTSVDVISRVQGMERVSVPAGEFDAIRVQRDLYYQDAEWWRSGVSQRLTDWYAPSVNLVVMRREDSQYVDYTRGGDRGGGSIIYGDYLKHELVERAPARP
jgi:hypothetical protein